MNEPMPPYHFQLIARALAVMDSADHALTLAELSAKMGISEAHFQRVFSAWVGVSPQRYQQYLALSHARSLLAQRFTTLDTAAQTGLSGTSRLHDMFLTWEAMTPGQYARAGEGLAIGWDWVDSAYGPALVMATDRGICGLAFAAEKGADWAMQDLRARWPKARFAQDHGAADRGRAALAGRGGALHLIGSPLNIKVWEALLHIPPAHVTSYTQIAAAAGAPRAIRAAATAVGRNPISLLIPCHRVLRANGDLGGYHWGLPVKRAILARESARIDAQEAAYPHKAP
ncbi:MAG: methylated-DNA--[protein]-cysteine S-methyltransferase [Cypionkella sp.]|nr:methylated-DNA--[protein]-cysteine S-methyltransferase [Cypionkella sp.]